MVAHNHKWILEFNLTSDKFKKIQPPDDVIKAEASDCTLGLAVINGGCLNLAQDLNGESIEMWKLAKDENIETTTWIKIMSITLNPVEELGSSDTVVPLPNCIMKNGEVLLICSEEKKIERYPVIRRFLLYDPVKCR
ncbi:hypothetical protein COLO4_13491 [Corchorus olitorius]|uniref:Uncharacterized protein n=1 Tax=Corchorus olitorius TaxID=93759 RepID=A0A1R3JWA5_9ROSI|nr:hypothetical protein COLO4_13491 [Corchorus olitorius]